MVQAIDRINLRRPSSNAELAFVAVIFFGLNQAFESISLLLLGQAFIALCTWDCKWYTTIAEHGYDLATHPHEQGRSGVNYANWAFFPAFPLVVSVVATASGTSERADASGSRVAGHDARKTGPWHKLHHLRKQCLAGIHLKFPRLSTLGNYSKRTFRVSNRHQTKSPANPHGYSFFLAPGLH